MAARPDPNFRLVQKGPVLARYRNAGFKSRYVAGWNDAYTAVRLLCPNCGKRLVYLPLSAGYGKSYAFCEQGLERCNSTLTRVEYLHNKEVVTDGVVFGDMPADHWPYIEVPRAQKSQTAQKHAAQRRAQAGRAPAHHPGPLGRERVNFEQGGRHDPFGDGERRGSGQPSRRGAVIPRDYRWEGPSHDELAECSRQFEVR